MDNKTTFVVGFLSKCALLCAALLILSSLQSPYTRAHTLLSAAPLALSGAAYAVLQIRLRPGRLILMKRLILAGTFILWAIDQLLPSGRLAVFIGDVVVVAYVADLFWIIQEQQETGKIDS